MFSQSIGEMLPISTITVLGRRLELLEDIQDECWKTSSCKYSTIVVASIMECMFYRKQNILLSEVHVIGHSLGAHIAGNIGRYFNGSLGHVTGLDPALPLFLPNSPDSLQSDAATFVDVIHTDYPVFGDITPRGTADFYPNFGFAPQHGCEGVDLLAASKLIFESCKSLYYWRVFKSNHVFFRQLQSQSSGSTICRINRASQKLPIDPLFSKCNKNAYVLRLFDECWSYKGQCFRAAGSKQYGLHG